MLPEDPDRPAAGPKNPLEVRETPHVASDVPVELYTTDIAGPLPGRTRDVSIGGACIATATPFAVKALQRLVLNLPRGPLALAVEGCWQRDAEADDVVLTGVSFLEPAGEALDRLWALLFASAQHLARFLYQSTPLRQLGLEESLGLAQLTRFREIPAGRYVYRQDTREPGEDSIFIAMSGELALQVRAREAVDIEIERLGVGAVFGGLPLLAEVPHAESAVALRDSRLLEIDANAFRHIHVSRPWLCHRLCQLLLRISATRLTRVLTRVRDQL